MGVENVKDLQSCTHRGSLIQLTETEIIVSGNESTHMELIGLLCRSKIHSYSVTPSFSLNEELWWQTNNFTMFRSSSHLHQFPYND